MQFMIYFAHIHKIISKRHVPNTCAFPIYVLKYIPDFHETNALI